MEHLCRSVVLVVTIALAAITAWCAAAPTEARPAATEPCVLGTPEYAVSVFWRHGLSDPDAPAIEVVRDTTDDDPSARRTLATVSQIGAVYGLAYSRARGVVYAAAYHKRNAAFGPAGPGGVYRIDVRTGEVSVLAKLQGGPVRHALQRDGDSAANPWVGKTSLGDLDLDESGTQLFVTNLYDRSIYRLDPDTGAVLGRFAFGAPGEDRPVDARPFGLGHRDGWLYHGAVDAQDAVVPPLTRRAYIYRSLGDGSQAVEVTRFPLDYLWQSWSEDNWSSGAMLTDIVFRASGDAVIGLRSRTGDRSIAVSSAHTPTGDLLPVRVAGGSWFVQTTPPHYQDRCFVHQDAAWGGLAMDPLRDRLVAAAIAPVVLRSGGLLWFDNQSGAIVGSETVYVSPGQEADEPTFGKSSGLGDVESLCAAEDLLATPTHTPTPIPTATATGTATPTPAFTAIPPATVTGTATGLPPAAFLPFLLRERCKETRYPVDVALVLDLSTSMRHRTPGSGRPKLEAVLDATRRFVAAMRLEPNEREERDQVAIAGFNATAWIEAPLGSDRADVLAAIDSLAKRVGEGSRLDLAFDLGRVALRDGRRPGNRPVLVVLTDGLPNGVPTAEDNSTGTTVRRAAERAKAGGTWVITIGVGDPDAPDVADRVDARLLADCATTPRMFYLQPDADGLQGIYDRIIAIFDPCVGRHGYNGTPWPPEPPPDPPTREP